MDILRALFKTRTRDEWIAELADIDACIGPVYTLDEALNDPQAQARGVTVTSAEGDAAFRTLTSFPRISGVKTEQRYGAPALGEHTDELLRSVGYGDAEIELFKAEGVV
jgi:crotonobetainyl-CoA:carnitine CoA-transferase CaiB-like acyl-CoA transferase